MSPPGAPQASDLSQPWLVAAWPGMGAIAQVAGGYLASELRAREIGEIPSEPYFEVQAIDVEKGLARAAALPRSRLFAWKNPAEGGRDLVLFLGEMQPPLRGGAFCEELIRTVQELGVTRVVTFAAMASPMSPQAEPRVLAVANEERLLAELRSHEIELLMDGQITGLNGLLLSAARDRGLGAICLLGEFPYFASAVPNPKSSAAVLRVFTRLSGIEIDMRTLDDQGRMVEKNLVEQLRLLQQAAGAGAEEQPEFETGRPDEVDPEVLARIDALFRAAARDRAKALELKAELDRHGLFKRYEDRFLDLFKQAE